ncbi:hypothetical protein ISCGN_025470 [Ixodes scapularis]
MSARQRLHRSTPKVSALYAGDQRRERRAAYVLSHSQLIRIPALEPPTLDRRRGVVAGENRAGSAAAGSDEWGTMRRKGASFPYAIIAMATTAPAGPTRSSRPQEQNPGSSPLGPPLVPSLPAAARCCTALGTRLYTKASLLAS